ncbi:MAG: hypothetical protein F7C32_02110 [Desulfurococcales archaeon]|nr:hypothetical protein [Desulfurococcales archaeon]
MVDEIVKMKAVPWSYAYKFMERRAEQEPGIMGVQQKTLMYLKEFANMEPEEAMELVRELEGLGLKDFVAANLVNICPQTINEIYWILQVDTETQYDPDTVEKIHRILSKHCSRVETETPKRDQGK